MNAAGIAGGDADSPPETIESRGCLTGRPRLRLSKRHGSPIGIVRNCPIWRRSRLGATESVVGHGKRFAVGSRSGRYTQPWGVSNAVGIPLDCDLAGSVLGRIERSIDYGKCPTPTRILSCPSAVLRPRVVSNGITHRLCARQEGR